MTRSFRFRSNRQRTISLFVAFLALLLSVQACGTPDQSMTGSTQPFDHSFFSRLLAATWTGSHTLLKGGA